MALDCWLDTVATVADVARAPARLCPDAPACAVDGRRTTFATFDRRANQAANGLLAWGLEPGDRIAVLARNSERYLEVAVAAARARLVLVAVNWRLAPRELAYVLTHAEARALFVDSEFLGALREAGIDGLGEPLVLDAGFEAWCERQPARDPMLANAPGDPIVQMYTSGTTGLPKGVVLTNAQYRAAFGQVAAYTWGRYGTGDVVFAPSPFFHVSGLNLALRALACGSRVVTTPAFRPEDLPRILCTERVTRSVMVPAVIGICLSVPGVNEMDFSALRSIAYGGSPVTQDLLRRARRTFGCDFIQGYGLTECGGQCTFLEPDDHDPARGKLQSCGRAAAGGEVRVMDDAGRVCRPGEVGEVVYRGPNVMLGYWRNAAATAETVRDGWLHTGDAGYLDADGYLYIHDRIKDMIVSGAENVYPAEVENALAEHPDVAEVAVIGVPDARWGEAVKAIVVRRPGADPDAGDLIDFVRTLIAPYKVPKSIDFVETLPRNASGKVLRRTLRAPFWANRDRRIG